MTARITLDQWRALVAVVDAGGYAQAAELIHKSQSTVTYAVQKIEHLLGLRAFEIRGRKAQLTPAGATLYRRARTLLEEAEALERGARSMAQGWAPSLRLAVEAIFPTWLLLQCFNRFALERPEIHIQLHETVLGGTVEALTEGRVDFAICSHVPEGFASDRLMRIRFVAAAHADHPLHQLGRPLTHDDLRPHRQLVIRDSAQQRILDSGVWLGADQRWTVSHKATSIAAATMGMGFAWYPAETIQGELASGVLKPLPLIEGAERFAELYLVFAERDCRGRAPVRMAEIIREGVESLWPD
ncbi:MAG: LysR family transcriptional regulator [Polycyclovorans sp.]|jgi:DNA-binding transcriptional LysR family regulator|nr:LysR family transcriptional regulator [Polycyclovorans sp.]MEC8850083.1 LysR family transcriptional regulator [Pseudomonadota bacterium]|tara:strand:- start:31182 stop:32081 length:900 start_codon:yes stop_codon:yes gene_type:complete